jgi:hypothetical protein
MLISCPQCLARGLVSCDDMSVSLLWLGFPPGARQEASYLATMRQWGAAGPFAAVHSDWQEVWYLATTAAVRIASGRPWPTVPGKRLGILRLDHTIDGVQVGHPTVPGKRLGILRLQVVARLGQRRQTHSAWQEAWYLATTMEPGRV